jgi:hypothetical protein
MVGYALTDREQFDILDGRVASPHGKGMIAVTFG